jgi:DNA-binding response OmpR family regulator
MRKPRIVIFDDDALFLKMLEEYFSMGNFEVRSFSEPLLCPHAENTGRCLNPCADIIITDFLMPRIDGIELLERQIRHGCTVDVRNKAVVSGALPDGCRARMKGLADTFFQKPFRMRDIKAWATECVSRSDLSQPLARME